MNKYLLGGIAAVALAAGSAALAEAAPPAKPTSRAHRAPQSELRTDVPGHVARMFARLDANKDGFITQAEIDAGQANRAAKVEKRAERFDPARMFARLDSNKDGKISEAEGDAAHNARVAAKGGKPAATHAGGGLFARLDSNKDGRVSLAEAQQMALQHFDRADLNHDNKLTPDERRQSRQQLKAQHKPS